MSHREQVVDPCNLVTGSPVALLDASGVARRLAEVVSDDDSV